MELKRERNVDALWAALMDGEPEVDESRPITSMSINQQSAMRLAAKTASHAAAVDRMKLRFSGQSTVDHRLAVRTATKGLLAIQESLSSVGASIVDHIGKAGRWPAEIIAATELKFTPRVLPGSIEFALVHTPPGEDDQALFKVEKEEPLFERSLSALLALFGSLADDNLATKTVTDQLVSFGPRTSKHLFDLAQLLVAEDLSLDVEWRSPEGKVNAAVVGRRSAAYLKELAKASASSTRERVLIGQLITVSEVDKQGLLLDDSSKVLLEAGSDFQDELAALYRRRVQARVEETLTVNLSTGAETRNYVLTAIAPFGAASLAQGDPGSVQQDYAGWADLTLEEQSRSDIPNETL
ncbi:hypothetical protein [Pseudarthrobacter sp. lyk4-40-TYG-27]|uniref:hypothetical protein n=1 Tax=Pseudarthrobacter sp. lyk4-40-TYG-27 TaxID=3040305 RepID=UPI002555F56A|nr:hypothetical protein [Pseudarthrobacter sp. lyk4-40-TYG-27]